MNSETKKINGVIKQDIKPHELKHVCAFLTFNKPFRLILLEYIEDDQPTTQQGRERERPLCAHSLFETSVNAACW